MAVALCVLVAITPLDRDTRQADAVVQLCQPWFYLRLVVYGFLDFIKSSAPLNAEYTWKCLNDQGLGKSFQIGDYAFAEWKLTATQTLSYASIKYRIPIDIPGCTIIGVNNAKIVQWSDELCGRQQAPTIGVILFCLARESCTLDPANKLSRELEQARSSPV